MYLHFKYRGNNDKLSQAKMSVGNLRLICHFRLNKKTAKVLQSTTRQRQVTFY